MSSTASAPPMPARPPVPTWDPAPPAVAGRLSQALALVAVGLALWLVTLVGDAARLGLEATAVLAASVVVGIATGAHRAFRALPGLVAALLVFLVLSYLATLAIADLPAEWGRVLFFVPLVPIGLDWHRVGRIRAALAVAAFLIVPISVADRSGALVAALGWFAIAAAALWSLEQDRRRSEDRPQPLVPGATDSDPHPGDLLRTVVAAVAVGLLAALLLSVPSCNFDLPGTDAPGSVSVDPGDPGSGDPGSDRPGSGEPGSGQTGTGEPGTGRPGSGEPGDGTSPGADGDGGERRSPPSPPRFSAWWLLALVALAAAVALFWWHRSRAPSGLGADREWALALVEQIDDAGRARGRPRPESSTVLQHTDDLAGSVLPDDRLRSVGRLLSDALFGQTAISAHTRLWAQSVVDEIVAANPVPGRRAR